MPLNRTKSDTHQRQCATCGRSFYTRASELRIGRGRFCSLVCRSKGPNHPKWKGGRNITTEGYIRIYAADHPYADKNNSVFEHRLVMESHLGRYLEPSEIVHHINGVKTDNRIENLEVMTQSEHARAHHTGTKRPRTIGWSKLYDVCRRCGTADYRHHGVGYCVRCRKHKDKPLPLDAA